MVEGILSSFHCVFLSRLFLSLACSYIPLKVICTVAQFRFLSLSLFLCCLLRGSANDVLSGARVYMKKRTSGSLSVLSTIPITLFELCVIKLHSSSPPWYFKGNKNPRCFSVIAEAALRLSVLSLPVFLRFFCSLFVLSTAPEWSN